MAFSLNYFSWLQQGNPTGVVDRFPELKNQFETSVPGIYCVGDLTGIPLIKLAAESGFEFIEYLEQKETFQLKRKKKTNPEIYDLIITGAGPAGVAAAAQAKIRGYRYLVLESSRPFNTIANFPTGKPIYVTPKETPVKSALSFRDGTKETLQTELQEILDNQNLEINQGEKVTSIEKSRNTFTVHTSRGNYSALAVAVAIGKTGNPKALNVPGENLPKVFTRLIDPGEHRNQDILIVGGGDSALEAANALAESGNRVILSYRKSSLSRPKEHNIRKFETLAAAGKIKPELESTVKEISEKTVVLKAGEKTNTFPNDVVYALIGTEIPIRFFRRIGIRMEGYKNLLWGIQLTAMVSFFTMLYFGKAGFSVDVFKKSAGLGERISAFLSAPFLTDFSWGLKDYAWYGSLNFLLGWLGAMIFLPSGAVVLFHMLKEGREYFDSPWKSLKYTYLIFSALFFTWVYLNYNLGTNAGWVEEPTFYYSLLYTTTIILFGIRRMRVNPTRYIHIQTATLMFIQVFFLFLLPFYLYDNVLARVFSPDSFVIREIFPQGKWSSFGLILFWPLNINNFGTSTFWIWFPFLQTFGILFLIVQRWGKGAYCGWICSCGAMAETLGDEYRRFSPHGPKAKKMENIGQIVLMFAFIAAGLHFAASSPGFGDIWSDTLWGAYKLSIDVFFAGVLGLGVYFFMGGRVWCRYGCPLAALMHIYTRFSPYRILANKKRCISCNICTKVCHMGIDVMGYANKGIPMNDAECVRCSACIVNCPMQVLTFGSVGKADPGNRVYGEKALPLTRGWASGLPEKDIAMLVEEDAAKKSHGGL